MARQDTKQRGGARQGAAAVSAPKKVIDRHPGGRGHNDDMADYAARQTIPAPTPAPAAPAVEDQDQAPAPAPVTVTTGGGVGQETGGALVALFLWPLIFNLVKGGPAQMWGWVKAKFVNEPYSASGAGPSTPAKPATAGASSTSPAAAAAAAQGRPNPGSVAGRL